MHLQIIFLVVVLSSVMKHYLRIQPIKGFMTKEKHDNPKRDHPKVHSKGHSEFTLSES